MGLLQTSSALVFGSFTFLILAYFAIVFLMWLLPSPRIIETDGEIDTPSLFGYAAAVLVTLLVASGLIAGTSTISKAMYH